MDCWQFWIDVGGTFTDCFAISPCGEQQRLKVLSSGATKGAVGDASTGAAIVDPHRAADPAHFWEGYELVLLGADGETVDRAIVSQFDRGAGRLALASPLRSPPRPGQPYELRSGEEAPVLAIRWLMGLRLIDPIPPAAVRLGTTRGTNALITRRGAKTALVTTRGFADVLRIGYQDRPRLFELAIRKHAPLFADSVEIDERLSVGGEVLRAPDPAAVRLELQRLQKRGIESLAICLLHAYRNGVHERIVAEIARELGFAEISVSSELAPLVKIVARGDTTVVDAYLNPVLRGYVAKLRRSLAGSDLRILTSAGGLVSAERFVGKDSILSGPAGGVVGFSRVARAAGFEKAIGFDMGGTSTDVARFDGRYRLEYETEKAGVRIVAPMMAIETVAAGGGSICRFDGAKLTVGPDSAGADPGPACYGRGGPLAVTDLNFYLGRIRPERFPFPLQREAVETRLARLCHEIEDAAGTKYSLPQLAEGFLQIANANMAGAVASISLAEGADPREYVLVAFGGAAPQHACGVARLLGITQILNHPDGGILSAYGIGLADIVRHRVAGIYRPYSTQSLAELAGTFAELERAARGEVLVDSNVGLSAPYENEAQESQIRIVRSLDLRYRGVDAALTIAEPQHGDYAAEFTAQHQQLYGYVHAGRALEIVAARVEATGQTAEPLRPSQRAARRSYEEKFTTEAWFAGRQQRARLVHRQCLEAGDVVVGPAIVLEDHSTTVIDPGWEAETLSGGELLLTDARVKDAAIEPSPARRGQGEGKKHEGATDRPPLTNPPTGADASAGATVRAVYDAEPLLQNVLNEDWQVGNLPHGDADPILLEVFNNRFAAIAAQMGITLRNTASSVNVKERLDFSCAIFTARGELVVNAPHIPVHLGAMGETVRHILADNATIAPGDVLVTNDPYRGGSHLPDITVVTPVHDSTGELLLFTASRAHHAEIGGTRPGSVPPDSRNLAEEGVLISNFKLVDRGESREAELRAVLLGAKYPTRNAAENLADIAAQVAANRQGARDLLQLIAEQTRPVVLAYMRHIQQAAAKKVRRAIAALPDGRREFVDHLDDGSPIAVAITIAGERMTIDFTGTGPVLACNLNANRAIVTAAVMYVLRLLIAEEIPLNEGVLEPIELIVPECLLNPPARENPEDSPPVVGGNTETSQRVADVLLGALGLAAASQGTMNSVAFGDATFSYYETICGGSGATADADGADAVHTHMTNTRLTDPEVLEARFPARVREFAIRRGSGGRGAHRGGDGVRRQLAFLRAVEVCLLSSRRGAYPPYGQAGGEPGALGRNTLVRADGTQEQLHAQCQFTARPGDTLIIETPGGGGWGAARDSE